MAVAILFALFLALLPIYFLLTRERRSKRLPPGSLGIPIIGQSLGLLRAMRSNTGEKWLESRINKYGPVSKLTLFGAPAVLLTGPAANRFIFSNADLVPKQPQSIRRILGEKNILELIGDDHKRVRGVVSLFLRPEMLKMYLGKIEEEVKQHLEMNWSGRAMVTVLPLMKSLTFDVICSVLFGLEKGPLRKGLGKDFTQMLDGLWAIPINLPFTHFNNSLRASRRARKVITSIIQKKRIALKENKCSSHDDLITYLLSASGEANPQAFTEEEMVDNAMLMMIAGHDTTSILLTFLVRRLANDPKTYAAIAQEQEEIAKSKTQGETLAWDDLIKMKYTWRAAMETLRTIPPIFGGFRRALKDLEYCGYLIPKGWQVFWATNITHMDEKIFPDASKFDPARFENPSSIPPYCFVAFGAGPRICPGNEFARMETLVAMHYLITRFKWKLNCKDDSFVRDPFPSPSHGLPIQLEPKKI